jgi:hypothetical protein
MARLIKAVCIPSIGSWFLLLAALALLVQNLAAQQVLEVPGEAVRIADLGLEDEIPSAIDLVGPDHGSAGRNRELLAHRLQCWVDGIESCTFADRNDDRVRDMRRFLVQGPKDRDGTVSIHFGDQTRIEVSLVLAAELDRDDWEQRFYRTEVVSHTVRAPGLVAVPSSLGQFAGFEYEGTVAIRAALDRLKQRLEASAEPDRTAATAESSDGRPTLLQRQLP